jgi:adenylate kinase
MGLNLVIIGPPGAGKGTQASRLAHDLRIAHLSTGDLLRREASASSPVGVKVKSYIDAGLLVPDQVMTEMVAPHVLRAGRGAGFILDGFPRTVEQAQDVHSVMGRAGVELSGVINVQLPDAAVVDRLVNRQTCSECQRSYHAVANRSKLVGRCDACGASLVVRKDDNEQVIRQRMRVYREQTAPVVEYYRARGLLRNVDGSGAIESIAAALRATLAELHAPSARSAAVG